MSEDLSWVINFANSIVGVGVLAIPFCFYKCGVVLAILLIFTSSLFAKKTCEYLLKTAQVTRRNSIEALALNLLGPVGKLITEVSTIFLLIGTLIAFQVVIGDLAPSIVHFAFGFEETWRLRAILMVISSAAIIPLALMRNVQSLAGMNALSMAFYSIFIVVIILLSLPNFFKFEWWTSLHFWEPSGFFHCLPIIFLAFSCQTQVFIMYAAIPDPSLQKMSGIIGRALDLCTAIYSLVGLFGYIAFFEHGIHGDILANFPSGLITQALKTGFWMSVVVSFPLIAFPVRAAINSLLFSQRRRQHEIISSASDYIPQDRFMYITFGLVIGTLVTGILVPKIETVLSLTGALVGTFVCFVLPAALYLLVLKADDSNKMMAQVILILSIFAMITSTVTVMSSIQSSNIQHHLDETKPIKTMHHHNSVKELIEEAVTKARPLSHNKPDEAHIHAHVDEVLTGRHVVDDTLETKKEPSTIHPTTKPVAVTTAPLLPTSFERHTNIVTPSVNAAVVTNEEEDPVTKLTGQVKDDETTNTATEAVIKSARQVRDVDLSDKNATKIEEETTVGNSSTSRKQTDQEITHEKEDKKKEATLLEKDAIEMETEMKPKAMQIDPVMVNQSDITAASSVKHVRDLLVKRPG